ncbi:STAS domain-containing protein [Chloroflexia bacterium SDU3-3]|nr:STAS domain-containing protein [Chloroflexia bacterium SDU3-3]
MSLESVLAAQQAAVEQAAKIDPVTDRVVLVRHVLDGFASLIGALLKEEQAEIDRQRTQMEQAFFSTVDTQRQAEDALRSAIRELSTPIMPVSEGILVLPLVGSIDSHRAGEINERLLEGIAEHQAEIVIIDITGVPLMDTSTANLLLMTTKAANLLGSQIILCGIGAEIAQTITHLGVDLSNLTTMSNLQSSISYALEQTGLAIKPL